MKKITQHPVLLYANDIQDICKPLRHLNISYFSHVNIDNDNQFTAMSNNPEFHQHYLENKYYHVDIHLSGLSDTTRLVLWSGLACNGNSEKMRQDAEGFKINNTFTIIDKDKDGENFYHFATHVKDSSFNQNYLSNLDLLQSFIQHFNDNVHQSKELMNAYRCKFKIEDNQAEYSIHSGYSLLDKRNEFLNETSTRIRKSFFLNHHESKHLVSVSKQQMKCLQLLMQGISGKEVAKKLELSDRTVNHYLETLRDKLGCKTSKELIALYYSQVVKG